MATNQENYTINIEVQNERAKQALRELQEMTKQIQTSYISIEKDPGSDKAINDLIGSMVKFNKYYNETVNNLEQNMVELKFKGDTQGVKAYEQNLKDLAKSQESLTKRMNDASRTRGDRAGKISPALDELRLYNNELSATQKELQKVKNLNKEIKNRSNQVGNIGRSAINSGIINAQQAANMRGSANYLTGDNAAKIRENVTNRFEDTRAQITEKKAYLQRLENGGNEVKNTKQHKILIQDVSKEIDELNQTIKELQRVNSNLDLGEETVKTTNDTIATNAAEGNLIRELGNTTTFLGRIFERASSVSMAIVGAGAYQATKTYQEGKAVSKKLSPDSIRVGQQTGDYDFRGIRRDQMAGGIDPGFNGEQMLDFTNTVLQNAGYTDQATLDNSRDQLSQSARAIPVDTTTLTDAMGSMMKTGAISSAEQMRAIENGFLGGIQKSGMAGREKEQLDALTSIYENLTQGRTGSEQELQNRAAMQSVFASTGSKGMQGEMGAEMMKSMDDLIKNSGPNTLQGILMGAGSDPRYQGAEGRTNFYRDRENGATAEVYSRQADVAMAKAGGNATAAEGVLQDITGGVLSPEQAQKILELNNSGQLTESNLEQVKEDNNLKGEDIYEDNFKGYSESIDASANTIEAASEKIADAFSNNALTDILTKTNETLKRAGAKNTATAVGMTGVSILGTMAMSGGAAGAWGGLSKVLTKLTSTVFKGAGGAGTAAAGAGGAAATAGGIGGFMSSIGGKAKGLVGGTKAATTAGEVAAGGVTAATEAGGIMSQFGKTKGVMGKVAPVVAAAISGMNILSADDKSKAAGKEVGALAGGLGGMKLGAVIGTAIAPGIGTAIGGALGGIGGGIAGSAAGSWIGEKFGGLFGGGKDKEEITTNKTAVEAVEDSTKSTEEKATSESKNLAEKLRKVNNSTETENLSFFEKLLAQMTNILAVAKAQNGIVGDTSGLSGGGGGSNGSGSGVSGELGTTDKGDFWTSNNLKQHDLGKTTDTLTAGQLNDWIDSNTSDKPGSKMKGMGEAFMKAGAESGLDPRYLVAHAAHETGWGTSDIVNKKNNMFGIGAFDASPGSSAYSFSNPEEGIIGGAKWIAENYYAKGNTDLDKMKAAGYATDPGWGDKIANTMKGSEKYTSASSGAVTNNVNVTLNGSGNTEKDAQIIATTSSLKINNMYTQQMQRV